MARRYVCCARRAALLESIRMCMYVSEFNLRCVCALYVNVCNTMYSFRIQLLRMHLYRLRMQLYVLVCCCRGNYTLTTRVCRVNYTYIPAFIHLTLPLTLHQLPLPTSLTSLRCILPHRLTLQPFFHTLPSPSSYLQLPLRTYRSHSLFTFASSHL